MWDGFGEECNASQCEHSCGTEKSMFDGIPDPAPNASSDAVSLMRSTPGHRAICFDAVADRRY